MPEMDWLTGLSSRAAFSRQVGQADRDRDRFAIALIELEDFGEINRQLDYETGDELLRVIGQALAFQTSVNTFAARLGGAQFAVLTVQRLAGDLQAWIGPIVAAVKAAIGTWTFDLIDYTGECVVEPELRVGAASGFSSRVWGDAATALDLAQTDPVGGSVVLHDAEDPRFVARGLRQALADNVVSALDAGTLEAGGRRIDVVGGQDPDWRWLRLGVLEPAQALSERDGSKRGPDRVPRRLADTTMLPATVERQLENWLIEQAGKLLTEGGGQLRLTVPVSREVTAGRAFAQRLFATLERFRIPPSRMLFEVDETALVEAGAVGRDFTRQLQRIGSGVAVANCQGGWHAWQAICELPILYVKPHPQLVDRAANGDQPATRILGAIVNNATDCDQELIAPPSTIDDTHLTNLGITYREQTNPEL